MSPIDAIVSCDCCGTRLNEADYEEEYFYVTVLLESSEGKKKRKLYVYCSKCVDTVGIMKLVNDES